MDDILVWGATVEEHDWHLSDVLACLSKDNLTLNKEKCIFRVQKIKFLGFLISEDSITVDLDKVSAISKMKAPTTKTELQSLLGTVNFLARHIPRHSSMLLPLHNLLQKDIPFVWSPAQQDAFDHLKTLLANVLVLAVYDPTHPTIVSADASFFSIGASFFSIGAVLLQISAENTPRPVAHALRFLTDLEWKYAQIKKEMLTILWACDKFKLYIIEIQFRIKTDHKPLVPILTTKFLDNLSHPGFRKCAYYSCHSTFWSSILRAKTSLWLIYLLENQWGNCHKRTNGKRITDPVEILAVNRLKPIPIQSRLLDKICMEQSSGNFGKNLYRYILEGWPTSPPDEFREYHKYEGSLCVLNGAILFSDRLWIQAIQIIYITL